MAIRQGLVPAFLVLGAATAHAQAGPAQQDIGGYGAQLPVLVPGQLVAQPLGKLLAQALAGGSGGAALLPATATTLGGVTVSTGLTVTGAGALSANVISVFGRGGAVTLSGADVTAALGFSPYNATNPAGYIGSTALVPYAPLASPALTGTPTAPTVATADNSTSIATTAWVRLQGYGSGGGGGAVASVATLTGAITAGALTAQLAGVTGTSLAAGNDPRIVGAAQRANEGRWNVLDYAAGIPINDGATHTVANAPAGNPYAGATTLAQLAAVTVNGVQPLAFLTDTGTMTGPACTAGGTANCFTAAGGAWHLTDADAPTLDLVWALLQAGNINRHAYRPAGTYRIGTARAMPLMISIASDASGFQVAADMIEGDGPDATVILAGSDWGAGKYMEWCGDPAGTQATNTGRYAGNDGRCKGYLRDMSYRSPPGSAVFGGAGNTAGMTQMGGLAWGARLELRNISGYGLNCAVNFVGDQTVLYSLHALGGINGLCKGPPNTILYGDLTFVGARVEGQTMRAIQVDGNATLADTWVGGTYMSAPMMVGGLSNGCAPLSSKFLVVGGLFAEYLGNRAFEDENATPCRALNGVNIDRFSPSFSNSNHIAGTVIEDGTQKIMHASQFSGRIDFGGLQGQNPQPNLSFGQPNAAFDLTDPNSGLGNNVEGISLGGELDDFLTVLGSTPLFAAVKDQAAVKLHGKTWDGGVVYIDATTGATYGTAAFPIRNGDCIEREQYNAQGCGVGYIQNEPILGIVKQGGPILSGHSVPYANSGNVFISIGWDAHFWSMWAKGTGIGNGIAVTPGSGYTTGGPYAWTSTGCGTAQATGTVSVVAGALAAPTITNPGAGCGVGVAVAVPAAAGAGTGGAIAVQWPSALAQATATPLTVGYIGVSVGDGSNNTSAGGGALDVILR